MDDQTVHKIISVCPRPNCTACSACVNICPRKCIEIQDNSFFAEAVIDNEKCIHCGLCKKVCQVIHSPEINSNDARKTYVGKAIPENNYKRSSSGGLATVLSETFLKEEGYVCGVVYRDGKFKHILTNNLEDLRDIAGSKYVKSNLYNTFSEIKNKLLEQKVLFIGLPCQVYGLKKYLEVSSPKLLERLFTIDLVCHGSPMQSIFDQYISEQNITKVETISFRNKTKFWFVVNNDYKYQAVNNPYMQAYFSGLIYSENCFSCAFAREERVGDITLGDSWYKKDSSLQSLILVNTYKGNELLKSVEDHLKLEEADFNSVAGNNSQLHHPVVRPKHRDYVVKHFKKTTIKRMMFHIYPYVNFKQVVKKILIDLKIYSKGASHD